MTVRVAFLSLTHRFDDTRILHKEARALAEAGFEVMHLAPDYGGETPPAVDGIQIILHGKRSFGRLARLRALWSAAWIARADCYHCNEVESWILACALKALRPHTRIVFDVHEHYPSRFTERGRFPRWVQVLGGPLLRFVFRALTPWTDHLIFAKRSVAPDFRPRRGQATLIFNYAPLRIRPPRPEIVPLAIRSLFSGDPTAIHIGGFSRQRGWPQLLEALAQTTNRRIRVLALGEVEEGQDVLMAEAARLGVADRIRIIHRVPYQDLFSYLVCANVGLMLYQPGIVNHVFAFPMKLYDYMLAGLPVIGPNFAPEVTPVVAEERIGWLIDTADPQAIAAALDAAGADHARAREMGARGRDAVQRTYNWEREAIKLVAIYDRFAHDLGMPTPSRTVRAAST